jgi:hypothetical protein
MRWRLFAPASAGSPFDLLAPGLYAWGVTVAWPASERLASLEARIFALVALAALVLGAGLAFAWALTGRIIGIWIFLSACIASWAQMTPSLFLARLDPVQGLLGSFGWGLFALSWARQEKSAILPTSEGQPPTSPPRQALPWHAPILLAVVAAAALLPMVLAWWVKGLERALVAHVVALAGAVALVTYAADFADVGSRNSATPGVAARSRLLTAAPYLLLLGAFAVLGALWSSCG